MKLHLESLLCSSWKAGLFVLLAAAVSGCGRDDIQVYRVAKDAGTPSSPAQQPGMPADHPQMAGRQRPGLSYKTPSGWQETAPGEMRVASFRIQGTGGKQADVSVVPLPGLMGRDLENVNRWRESVSLPAVTEDQLTKLVQAVEVGGQPGQMYEQAGENPGSGDKTRIIVAVQRREGTAWFFKINGDDELVSKEKPAFLDFLKSVSFSAAQPGGEAAAAGNLPPDHPAMSGGAMLMSAAGDTGSASEKPNWEVPTEWKEVPGGQFLLAKFMVGEPGPAQAAVNVSMSAGAGGGLVMNVNRWRGQLGLGQLSEEEINKLVTPIDTAGGKAMFLDMTGTDPRGGGKARMIAAIVPQGNRTWFYKLMGDEQIVQKESDTFAKFVQTAKYAHAP